MTKYISTGRKHTNSNFERHTAIVGDLKFRINMVAR
jgi:hypothetical protein